MLRLDRRGSARSIALAKMMFAFAFVDKARRSRGMLRRGIMVDALGRCARHEVADYRSSRGRSSSRPSSATGKPNASQALNLRACGFTDSEDRPGRQLRDGSREVQMDSARSPNDPSAYFESLMQAGQQSFKQFDDAMAAGDGRERAAARQEKASSPFVAAAELQRDSILQFWRFWNPTLVKALGVGSQVQPGKGDKRFKDSSWSDTPHFDLLKQVLSAQLQAVVRFRRQGAGRREDQAATQVSCAAVHRRDEPVEFSRDQSGRDPHRDPDPLGEPCGRHAQPDRGPAEGAHHPRRRIQVRGRRQSRQHAGLRHLRERADPADRICAADG